MNINVKRAGVKWGIGRYLYKLGNLYSDNKENEIPQWARPKDKPPFEVAFWDLIKKLVPTGDPEVGEIAKSYHPNLSKIEKIELGKRLRMIENKYKQ